LCVSFVIRLLVPQIAQITGKSEATDGWCDVCFAESESHPINVFTEPTDFRIVRIAYASQMPNR